MSSFYLCSEINCNRKYKTKEKLINHVLDIHKIVLENIPEPILITKENKKIEENKKDVIKKNELNEQKIREIQRLKEINELAKKEVEEKYMHDQIEKFKQIEEEKINFEKLKIQQTDELIKLDQNWILLMDKIQENSKKNTNDCTICFDNKADTAAIPCGHKFFCYQCIDDYRNNYPQKGCPLCRKEILMISKIFS